MEEFKLNTIEEAIADFREGKFLIVVDDEDRENEGDFIIAAEKITPEAVNFMLKEGRGVLCVPITMQRCAELELPRQVGNNTSILGTPFTVTVDKLEGCSTGVSIYDRAATIQALADPTSTPATFGRPGHINPLYAQDKGVLKRAGHTEAAVDLARLAGLQPCGALIEIMNEDGTMARMPQLIEKSRKFGIKIIAIRDLIAYRLKQESLVEKGVEVDMPTEYGHFRLIPFRQKSNGLEHIAIIKGDINPEEPVLVRVHSSCMTGDIFGSMRCDCGEQLHKALQMIDKEGKGAVVYLNQEGRGIGLMEKMKAYKLQENGMDTVDANLCLGHKADERDYGVGAEILRTIGISKMRLITNNPVKRVGLESYGLSVVENVPIEITPNEYNERYLMTKKDRMGHTLKFNK
ncbi:MAG: bifunctional 3,4-dihydroxy-2-butanone-4-phosphate synthase/GTP cyclohydrolase II [Bacteroidaceae bacterium]|nr:bifunctional 3,4-dihydroxy-2-butanone-4-phosphate synthase/GTP cyclohydrolase II [Bacteroidaceae bacterium]MBR4044886.1 bifunctional 3,4-dihydroxy-2-butanone-4-phosphate synthase/GTP cyclohydrolase II [Bacteroidaceae bacterium]